MLVEIERKFLVRSDGFRNESKRNIRIVQGFLNTDPFRTVRVRIKGDSGFLTVKGIGNDQGTTRFEWEIGIPLPE
ncbi:MAG TPA: CYTH domain-containing protein, partial [Arenibacter sp.]|nr:CYTH domain-containing protein [Arenibacter sp.]